MGKGAIPILEVSFGPTLAENKILKNTLDLIFYIEKSVLCDCIAQKLARHLLSCDNNDEHLERGHLTRR